MKLILIGKLDFHILGYRPINIYVGVVPHKTALVIGMIKIIDLINELSLIRKDKEAVCEVFGNKELTLVFCRKDNALPLTEGGTTLTQVNRNIENLAADTAHKL